MKLLFLFLFIFGSVDPVFSISRCMVCGMEVEADSKTSFQVEGQKSTMEICSFMCAARLKEKEPNLTFKVRDYISGKFIDAKNAIFITGSAALANEVKWGMPPVVSAFQTEKEASKELRRLGDGKMIIGFDALRRQFQ